MKRITSIEYEGLKRQYGKNFPYIELLLKVSEQSNLNISVLLIKKFILKRAIDYGADESKINSTLAKLDKELLTLEQSIS